jgi:hypothetical protein
MKWLRVIHTEHLKFLILRGNQKSIRIIKFLPHRLAKRFQTAKSRWFGFLLLALAPSSYLIPSPSVCFLTSNNTSRDSSPTVSSYNVGESNSGTSPIAEEKLENFWSLGRTRYTNFRIIIGSLSVKVFGGA